MRRRSRSAIGSPTASANGSTLQLGIGAIPDAALACLVSRRGSSIWSEMISDGVLALEHRGLLDRQVRAHERMVSVNSALQVDLYGQVNASRIRGRIYSGFGGQTDFIVGALHAKDGQAIIALGSWHPKAQCSTIVPMVEEPVTSFQPTIVVTENGIAEIFDRPEREQAAQLIHRAAHPRVRDELSEEALALGLA